jgi:transcriptional regulator with XRE-family HTH domain
MKIKNCGSFLKERRKLLKLEQQEVSSAIGVKWETYRQWECRQQIPEKYLSKVATALRMSMLDIQIARWKPHIEKTFCIDSDSIELFFRRNSKI